MTHKHTAIEDRLTVEARRIFAAEEVNSAVGRILAEHSRRDRRRRRHRGAAVGVLAGIVLAAMVGMPQRRDEDVPRQIASPTAPRSIPTEPQPSEPGALLTRLRVTALRDAGGEGVVAIPLLVAVGEWQGRPIVAPVVYVPPHARRVDHATLTKGERSAVERLLNVTSTTRGKKRDVVL